MALRKETVLQVDFNQKRPRRLLTFQSPIEPGVAIVLEQGKFRGPVVLRVVGPGHCLEQPYESETRGRKEFERYVEDYIRRMA